MKKIFDEFKKFIMRGNVVDLAVAVLVGGAFQSIVTSLCDNLISPILGLFGGMNFDNMSLDIFGVSFGYGSFITAVINFFIVAVVAFLLVMGINAVKSIFKKDEEEQAPKTKKCPYCKSEIDIEATRCPHCTSELE